jgi:hypothetical protein
MYKKNVTLIKELPNLEDVHEVQALYYPKNEQIQKMIRNPHVTPQEAGMQLEAPSFENMYYRGTEPLPIPPQPLHCVDIANHIKDCPVCSKLYHHDSSSYIAVIVVLVIICLILTQKILNS